MQKNAIRRIAKQSRAACARDCRHFAERIAAFDLGLAPGACVAGYAAIKDEADPSALMRGLASRGHPLALPRVAAKDAPLVFHAWQEGDALIPGPFGIMEPSAAAPVLRPDVLLVPLLAFDAAGYRLGYGGGFYDRSIAATPGVIAIGIGYAGQEIAALPHDAQDQRLDAVLTEAGLRRFT